MTNCDNQRGSVSLLIQSPPVGSACSPAGHTTRRAFFWRMKLTTLKPRITTTNMSRVRTLDAVPGSWRSGKKTSERGYGWRWQQARERFLSANPLCAMCADERRVELATVVDHIDPHRGDERLFWDESNWQPLCKRHHDSDKKRQENTKK